MTLSPIATYNEAPAGSNAIVVGGLSVAKSLPLDKLDSNRYTPAKEVTAIQVPSGDQTASPGPFSEKQDTAAGVAGAVVVGATVGITEAVGATIVFVTVGDGFVAVNMGAGVVTGVQAVVNRMSKKQSA